MRTSKSWQVFVFSFYLGLFFPWGWVFWLSWRRLNYYSFTFSLADAWLVVFFFLGLGGKWLKFKTKLLLLLLGGGIYFFYQSASLFWWLRFYFYLRVVLLSLLGAYLSQRVSRRQLRIFFSFSLFFLALVVIIDTVWLNFSLATSPFHFFFLDRYWAWPTLFFPHPNVLAFAGVSLFLSWLLLTYKNKHHPSNESLVHWLAVSLIITLSGSLSGGLIIFLLSLIFEPRFSPLIFLDLFLLGGTTDWQGVKLHFSWLFPSSFSFSSFWPTSRLSLNVPQAGEWFAQPVHNTFYLIGRGVGWFWLVVAFGGLVYLWWRGEKVSRWVILSLILWVMVDHFFITTTLGQNLTALLLSVVAGKGLKERPWQDLNLRPSA